MKVRLGIDLGGSFIKAGILGNSDRVLYRVQIPSGAGSGVQAVKLNLKKSLQLLIDYCHKCGHKPVSLGIGSPGTIRQPDGKVTDASPNIAGWKGTTLTTLFGKLPFPVFADNDANCAALSEYVIGLNCRYDNMVFMTIGTGIGGGIILNGALYRGSHYTAAEIGHASIRQGGKLCKCGRRGCLEAYASVPNMLKRTHYWSTKLGRKIKPKISPEELFALYKKGNQVARKTILENAEHIGFGLASLVNILNPDIIVIGGGFSGAGQKYVDLIAGFVRENSFEAANRKLKISKARLGNDAGFIGAAMLARIGKNGVIGK
jgi:glucokinase